MARPSKPESEKYVTKTMQFGRVPAEDRELLQSAAKKSGKTFIDWALPSLIKKAKRELGNQ